MPPSKAKSKFTFTELQQFMSQEPTPTVASAAAHFGVTTTTIYNWLKQFPSIARRPPGARPSRDPSKPNSRPYKPHPDYIEVLSTMQDRCRKQGLNFAGEMITMISDWNERHPE